MNITSITNATINAEALWGAAVVARAVEVDAAPITRELALRVADNARDLGAQGFGDGLHVHGRNLGWRGRERKKEGILPRCGDASAYRCRNPPRNPLDVIWLTLTSPCRLMRHLRSPATGR